MASEQLKTVQNNWCRQNQREAALIPTFSTNARLLRRQRKLGHVVQIHVFDHPYKLKSGARSIQPKFRPVRPGKEDHLKRWTRFFETFPVGPNRSIEFWTEISGNFGWMDRAPGVGPGPFFEGQYRWLSNLYHKSFGSDWGFGLINPAG